MYFVLQLLGQSLSEYSLDVRLDGQIKSPARRSDSTSSNMFKYRASTGKDFVELKLIKRNFSVQSLILEQVQQFLRLYQTRTTMHMLYLETANIQARVHILLQAPLLIDLLFFRIQEKLFAKVSIKQYFSNSILLLFRF